MAESAGKRTTWTLRLPLDLELEDLNGCTLDSEEKCLVIKGVSYKLLSDESLELSVLQSAENDDSDDADDDDEDDEESASSRKKKKAKKVSQNNKLEVRPTDGYCLVENSLDASDAMLKATNIDDVAKIRAYRHVPQISGLKRRWMPSGTQWKPTEIQLLGQEEIVTRHQPFEAAWVKEELEEDYTPAPKRRKKESSSHHKKASSSSAKTHASPSSSTKKRASSSSSKKHTSSSSSTKKHASSDKKSSSSKKSAKKESKEPKQRSSRSTSKPR